MQDWGVDRYGAGTDCKSGAFGPAGFDSQPRQSEEQRTGGPSHAIAGGNAAHPHSPEPARDEPAAPVRPLPVVSGGWRCIVADPPWSFRDKGSRIAPDGRARFAYSTLSTDQIAALPVDDIAADDAFLLLWTTDAHLLDGSAMHVATSWGFDPKRLWIWVKRGASGKLAFGAGHYLRGAHETLVLCRRGRALPRTRSLRTVFEAARGEHSRKPDRLLELAEQLSAGPYLELFARRGRAGWASWGAEAPEVTP